MNPIKYIQVQNIFTFSYSQEDYDRWNNRGKEFGDSGPLLLSIDYDNEHLTYLSYGTIENPVKTRFTMTIVHNELFDGKLSSAEDIIKINPCERKSLISSLGIRILDFSDINLKPNIKCFTQKK